MGRKPIDRISGTSTLGILVSGNLVESPASVGLWLCDEREVDPRGFT
ncbi:hypothetical protein HY573_02400 [Candidatus Parcubacteria bacterium]|nr:hypothetical protein [Candidatus Parcubacteria bacterium]